MGFAFFLEGGGFGLNFFGPVGGVAVDVYADAEDEVAGRIGVYFGFCEHAGDFLAINEDVVWPFDLGR